MVILLLSFELATSQRNLETVLQKYNDENIPYVEVSDAKSMTEVVFLDARTAEEFKVSHIPKAIHVGYKTFKLVSLDTIADKNQTLVVYCSIGVRSEDIAQQLKAKGYIKVFNLYGGIFEWMNQNQELHNSNGTTTDSIHGYSKAWSKWLRRGIKIYD